MDFVPRPRRSNTPPVDVPLLPGMPYLSTPPGEIKKYLTPPEMDITESATAIQIATFMQSRLFFGLLAQYLKTIPDLNEWTVQDKGDGRYRRLVSLDKLASSPFGEFERIKITSEKSGLQGIFSGLRSLMDELEYLPNAHEYPVPQVALSVRVLADALQTLYINEIGRERFISNTFHSVRTQNFRPCYDRRPAFYSTQDTVSPPLQIIHQRFKDNGWCHSRVNMLSKSFTYMTLYYMSQIKRCHPAGLDHQDCSESICTAAYRAAQRDRTDVSKPQHVRIRDTYEEGVYAAESKTRQYDAKIPNHLKGICIRKRCNGPCRMYHVRIEKVIEILENGWIPLVKIKPDEDGFLDVIPANMNSRYVAISHVWSDGMGNEEENGLFECQMRNILESLPHLPTKKGEVMSPLTFNRQHTSFPWSIPGFFTRNQSFELFWLDVLCIPTKQNLTLLGRGRDMDDIRRTAVGQIAATFAGATQVLVLDGETQTLRRDMCQMPEILAHFTACNWSARAWTYSEGAESLRAYVKLADGFFDPRDYELDARDWSGFTRPNPWSVRQLLQTSLEDVYSSTTLEKAIERCLSRTLQDFIHKSWFTKINRETDTAGPYLVSVWHSLHSRFRISRPPVIVFETAHRFVKVWNEMLTRDCTKPGDLMIIFAMALEIPAYEIFGTKDNKLKAMIWSLQEVPLGLLFTPCRERIQDNQHYDDDYWARIDLRANLNDLYPLRSTILVQGKFSAQKDLIFFNFPGDSDVPGSPCRAFEGNENIKVIAIPSLPGGFSWIKLLINGRVSLIRIHSPVAAAKEHVILIVDKLTFALEKGYSGKWAAGCCLFVQEVRSTRSQNTDSKWEFRTTYGSSISMMCYGDARNDQRIPELLDKELATESVALVEIHDKFDESGPTGEIHDAILISLLCSKL
ncbi:hypothetical protein N7488_012261 [Penicillium malachiteum]|nr:hypothetical protein N7488_012261 [Penicillium malachiteum]